MIKPVQMIIAMFVICVFIFPGAADYENGDEIMYTYHLTSGWNMVSLPVTPDNATASVIFGDNAWIVFGWTGTQYEYIPLDEELEPKKGYWVLANTTYDHNITGSRITDTSIALNCGWNMVGLVSSGVTVGSLTDIASVFEWTGTEYKELDKEQVLELTKAYWMLATRDMVISTNPVISVNAPETVSGTFDAVIDITDVTNLDSGQFDLSFNADVVNVTGVDPGNIGTTEIPVDDWTFIDNDTIRVLINLTDAAGVSGSGSLATIHFTVTGSDGDTCTLDISDGLLVDTDAVPIYAICIDSEITVKRITSEVEVPVSVNAPETVSGTFDAVIEIADVTDLDSGQFDLSFDPNVISVVDIKPGRIDGTDVPVAMWNLMAEGRIRVLFNLPDATGVSGSGKLARINFEVTGSVDNTSVLAISNGSLINTSANSIAANWTDDEITVVAPVEVTLNAPDTVSGTFDAVIDVTNVTDLDSAQFDLSFNVDVVNVTGVDPGSIGTTEIPVDDWSFIDNDTIRVLINLPEAAGVSGSGSLATIHFTVTGSNGDTCILDISDGLLVDTNAVPIYALWSDLEITVEEITAQVPVRVNAPEKVSGTFDAVIEIADVTNLDSGQFDLSFDPNVISVVDVKSGCIDGTDVPVDMWNLMAEGRIRVLINLPDITGVSGSGKLAEINFEVTGSVGNTSILAFSNGSLVDTSVNSIAANWTDDEITVEEITTGVPVSVNAPETVSGSFDAVIEIADVTNLDSGQFDLSFDPNVISVVDIKPGRIDGTDVPVDMWNLMSEGRIRVLFNLPDVTGVSGSGKLAKINFEVTGSLGNTSVLEFSNGSLFDTNARNILSYWTDDEITVAAPVEVTLNAPETVSGSFNAVIDITNVTDLDSAQFDLSFNADVVNVTGVDPGSIGTTEVTVDDWSFIDDNTIRVLINLPEAAGVSGSGSLATINFTVTGSGGDSCTLNISDGLLVDIDAVPIYALWFDLEITVEKITTGVPVSVNAPETVSGSFNATIDIEDVVDMNGGQFDLSFDPNVVNVTDVTSGIVGGTEIPLPEWNFINSTTIRVISKLPGANGMSGSGYVAKIHFDVTGSPGDTSVLDISNVIFSDTGADRISVTLIDDEVTVEADTVQVTVNAPDSVSGTFNATIDITDVTNLDSGQFDLSFNPGVVNVTGVDSGSIGETEIRLESWIFMDSGMIRVLFNLPGAAGVSGSGSLATIHFAVTGTTGDTSTLDISDGLLVDIEAEEICALWSDDEVSV